MSVSIENPKLQIQNPNASLALLEVANLTPALLVVDRCAKAAGVTVLGVESSDSPMQCIKLFGSVADVRAAGETGLELARQMGSSAILSVLPAPLDETMVLVQSKPAFSPLLGLYDARIPQQEMKAMSDAIGLLETQGLVAALHAADEMLKSASVTILGKEKIGAAYITIIVKGDVAAVQAAIASGKQVVERLGGKLIMADIIARPHPELAALLPTK
ncbi:MAG: BMC domain-containing protein [Pirellulales bacterium]